MKKVILTAGGKGTRVHELTGSVVPKSLCRISREFPRPLVAYQLDQIARAGFSDVLVVFEAQWQVQLFKQSVKIGEIPPLNYSYEIIKWKHPLNTFKLKSVLDFIGEENFLWTFGDIFYSPELLSEMSNTMKENNSSVASMMHSNSYRWKEGDQKLTFVKDSDNRISRYILTDTGNFTLHVPFVLQNRALPLIQQELRRHPPRTISLLKRLVGAGQLSVMEPDLLVNMNTPKDIQAVRKGIVEYN